MLNDRVLPFFEEHGVPLLRILTDRGSEYCGNRETHEYALYLDLESIEHTRTKTKSPQTNGICERFHQTIQNEFYASAFRRKLYHSLDEPSLRRRRRLMAKPAIAISKMVGGVGTERSTNSKLYGKVPLKPSWIQTV